MTPNVGISSITLFATDIDKTASFYQVLGINLEKTGSWSGYCYYLACLTGLGANQFFEVHPLQPGHQAVSAQGLGLSVDDVPEVLRNLLELGVPITRKPATPRLYQHCRHVTAIDPDGRRVRIHQRDK